MLVPIFMNVKLVPIESGALMDKLVNIHALNVYYDNTQVQLYFPEYNKEKWYARFGQANRISPNSSGLWKLSSETGFQVAQVG